MVGAKLLHMLEQRCHEIFPERNQLFGGLFVYFFGDIRQLTPVKDIPMYYDPSMVNDPYKLKGISIFNEFEEFIELQHSYRQGNDASFVELLDRLADAAISDEDYTVLCSRRESVLHADEKRDFQDAIHLLPTNA